MATTEHSKLAKHNGPSALSKISKESSDIVADWLTIYAEMYRQELSQILILAYHEGLADLRRPDLLHKAFARAMKSSKFIPNVAEIRDAYWIECESEPSKTAEIWQPLTKEETHAMREIMDELRRRLSQDRQTQLKPLSEEEFQARKDFLERQKKQILKQQT